MRKLGPGSFIEIRKILPLLTQVNDDAPSFHVVGLGLAGFGFSEGTKKKGFGLEKHAEVICYPLPAFIVFHSETSLCSLGRTQADAGPGIC